MLSFSFAIGASFILRYAGVQDAEDLLQGNCRKSTATCGTRAEEETLRRHLKWACAMSRQA